VAKPQLTLRGLRGAAPEEPAAPAVPQFDPAANTGEVGGVEGVKYVQGPGHLFNARQQYVRTDPTMAMAPLTPEQEAARQRQDIKNKRFFTNALPKIKEAGLPQKVLDAERENARALAAERFAAA
jgi:hypothetical protein